MLWSGIFLDLLERRRAADTPAISATAALVGA
jgi:hypothetical protein